MIVAGIGLAALAVGSARDPILSIVFLGGALAMLLVLGLVGWLIRLQQTAGVAVQSAAIDRSANPGQVNATLTLTRP